MTDPEGTRIGDAERQQVIDALSRATGEGRLTLDEFAERAGEVFAARTRDELDEVVRDLPAEAGWPGEAPSGPAPATAPTPGSAGAPDVPPADGGRPGGRRRFVAVMGGSRPRGRWRAAERITAFAFWGGVTIDLRQALIESPTLDITAWAIMGGVNVIVPEGIPVELDGFVLMGGASDHTRPGRPIDGAPLVRVRARGMWGGVTAWTRRERNRGEPPDPGEIGDVGDWYESLRGKDRHRVRHAMRHGAPLPPMPQTPPMPQMPPMPRLPDGRSIEDMIPPMPGQTREREPARAPDKTPTKAQGPTGSMRETGPATPTATTAGGAAATEPRPEPAVEAAVGRPPGGGTLTVLVTDICKSTEIAGRLGDQRWFGVLQAHNALVREQVHRHHGTEVKAQGDGFLVTFTSARQAVLAAIAVQRAMAEYRRAHTEHQIELRVGIHTGEVVEDDGDVIGQNVILAVRIADAAGPGEILVSSLTKDLTDAGGDLGYDDGREAELKGVARAWRLHAVTWA
jgi:class 3 adenylate cyclase